jgi:hypothetical protein
LSRLGCARSPVRPDRIACFWGGAPAIAERREVSAKRHIQVLPRQWGGCGVRRAGKTGNIRSALGSSLQTGSPVSRGRTRAAPSAAMLGTATKMSTMGAYPVMATPLVLATANVGWPTSAQSDGARLPSQTWRVARSIVHDCALKAAARGRDRDTPGASRVCAGGCPIAIPGAARDWERRAAPSRSPLP